MGLGPLPAPSLTPWFPFWACERKEKTEGVKVAADEIWGSCGLGSGRVGAEISNQLETVVPKKGLRLSGKGGKRDKFRDKRWVQVGGSERKMLNPLYWMVNCSCSELPPAVTLVLLRSPWLLY